MGKPESCPQDLTRESRDGPALGEAGQGFPVRCSFLLPISSSVTVGRLGDPESLSLFRLLIFVRLFVEGILIRLLV